MPLIEDKNQQVAFARAIGQEQLDPESADFGDLLQAAFRTENTLGSLIARESGLPDSIVNNESFNPWEFMTEDEKLDEAFVNNAITADDEIELEQVRKQSARERKEQESIREPDATVCAESHANGDR